jgi:hypothetical protein
MHADAANIGRFVFIMTGTHKKWAADAARRRHSGAGDARYVHARG